MCAYLKVVAILLELHLDYITYFFFFAGNGDLVARSLRRSTIHCKDISSFYQDIVSAVPAVPKATKIIFLFVYQTAFSKHFVKD